VTNCVRHTQSEFVVRVEQDGRQVRVEVTDRGPGMPTVRVPPVSEPSGRGLRIVRELADSYGVRPLPDAPGKTVWFVVNLESASDPSGAERNVPQA
jgi:signal transduction histidine kinase